MHAQRLEARHARRQHRPEALVEQRVLHLEVLAGGVFVLGRRHAAQPARAFGAEVHAARVDDQRAAGRERRAAHMEHAALARLHRQLDAGAARQRCGAGAGGIDQRAAGDAACHRPAHTPARCRPLRSRCTDPRLPVLGAERDGLAPQRHHQRVGVEPAFAAQAQRGAGQVVAVQPGKALAQRLGVEQLHLGAQRALRAVVGLQLRQAGRAGQEQVAGLVPAQVGRVAVHGQVLAAAAR